MAKSTNFFTVLPCLDSSELSACRQEELNIPRSIAVALGKSAVDIITKGFYINGAGERVDIGKLVSTACVEKRSIPPGEQLSDADNTSFSKTCIQVTNETTLGAAFRLVKRGLRPIALNFANGIQPGGGFLSGSRAQEEVICRSSGLYQTLINDKMYGEHRKRQRQDSTDWVIYSPNVPVFRNDDGTQLNAPWLLSFMTCAAPYAYAIGQPESGDLLQKRIHRILEVAQTLGYSTLILGAWGCGAFGNDTNRAALDFRHALETDFRGAFSEVIFAITDWSEERKFLGPFRDVFDVHLEI